jgi:hypothetical protein
MEECEMNQPDDLAHTMADVLKEARASPGRRLPDPRFGSAPSLFIPPDEAAARYLSSRLSGFDAVGPTIERAGTTANLFQAADVSGNGLPDFALLLRNRTEPGIARVAIILQESPQVFLHHLLSFSASVYLTRIEVRDLEWVRGMEGLTDWTDRESWIHDQAVGQDQRVFVVANHYGPSIAYRIWRERIWGVRLGC